MEKIIFIGLNEVNFSFIGTYIDQGKLPTFKGLFEKYGFIETTSENEYKLLEPWVQWVTIQTGKTFNEHNVFRLGDIVERQDLEQVFERVEKMGFTVGAISPFNADNRLHNSPFFIPDPWTQSTATGSKLIKRLSLAVSQAVNDNASSRLTFSSGIAILQGLLTFVPISKLWSYFVLLTKLPFKIGVKAMILDKLLGDTFIYNWKKSKPDLGWLFLNSGAHFQHHYMFNSSAYNGDFKNPSWYCPQNQDPLLDILEIYDDIIKRALELDTRIVLATGLHQKPHNHITFYWRLKKHEDFLKRIGINDFKEVVPRMSRDFLITFSDSEQALRAQRLLENIKGSDQLDIFEVDNRGSSLFVELIYSSEISDTFSVGNGSITIDNFKSNVAFVAIKNGEHDGIGYFLDTKRVKSRIQIPLTAVYDEILANFSS